MVAQTKFSGMLTNFRLRYIGEVDGDDDMEYGKWHYDQYFDQGHINCWHLVCTLLSFVPK